jgi:nucleoside diphosphate kinase
MLTEILTPLKLAQNQQISYAQVYQSPTEIKGKNEFMFFIKPEITLADDNIKHEQIIKLILDKIESVGLKIAAINVLSADYLEKYDIIAKHYGVINKISRDAKNTLTDAAKIKFNDIYGTSFNEAEVFGSLEFLKEFPEFTPLTLDYLWQNKKFEKLAGGTYALDFNFNGRKVFLINGFHPRQLDHFVKKGRSIITFTLVGDLNWSDARTKFIGATDPEKAISGSLRRYFLENRENLGLPSISSSWNGVHLSAGPIEGLVELLRYNSNFEKNNLLKPENYAFGKMLLNKFGESKLNDLMNNISLHINNQSISVFDLTEEKDSDEALNILIQNFK